jgi:integrase/recombinase XerD
MKPTDFSKYISHFISKYLPNEKGASNNTITAYRDSFVLLLNFIQNEKQVKLEKITLEKIKKETIIEFLDWIEKEMQQYNPKFTPCRHSFLL